MTAVVRLQVLREALGLADAVGVDEILCEARRLHAFEKRRVICLEACGVYAEGLNGLRQHIAAQGEQLLPNSEVVLWLDRIAQDAAAALERVPLTRESSRGMTPKLSIPSILTIRQHGGGRHDG